MKNISNKGIAIATAVAVSISGLAVPQIANAEPTQNDINQETEEIITSLVSENILPENSISVTEEPVTEEPVTEDTVVEEPVTEDTVVEDTVVEDTVVAVSYTHLTLPTNREV